jgi:hypothetical protein
MSLPLGTTWLDLFTLLIAGLGFGVAIVSLVLGIRTDCRESRTALRVELLVGAGVLILRVTNMAQRRVTAQRTGFVPSKRDDRGLEFIGWDGRSARISGGRVNTDPAFPEVLEPGAPTYVANAPLHVVRTAIGRDMPEWAWCEDERGNAYWARVPAVVRSAVRSTKRRVLGPLDEYGQPTEVEADDDD